MKKTTMPETIKSEKLVLRKHSLETAEQMFAYVDQDRTRLREFLPWVDHVKSLEDEVNYIKMTHKNWGNGKIFDYSIFESTTDKYIGNVGVHTISWENNRCELGYWILGGHEGKGLMSAAVSALELACFDTGFHRIEIRCSSNNIKSANVPKRLCYRLDGILRQEIIENGKYRDTLVYSKLKKENK